MCKLLGLPANLRFDPRASAVSASEHSDLLDSSRNTSAYTMHKTDHASQRGRERSFTTRECQAAVKHGAKTPLREGKVAHDHDGLRIVTDATHKIAVTGFQRDDPLASNARPDLLKTQLCSRFQRDGCCAKGANCWFAHGVGELRRRGPPPPQPSPPDAATAVATAAQRESLLAQLKLISPEQMAALPAEQRAQVEALLRAQ